MRPIARLVIIAALLVMSGAALLLPRSQSEQALVAELDVGSRLEHGASLRPAPPDAVTPSPNRLHETRGDGPDPTGSPADAPDPGYLPPGSDAASGAEAIRGPMISFGPAKTASFAPTRLRVPSIGLDVPVVQVGVDEQGRMATPTGYEEVGWYAPGPAPGAAGRAVIAGHVDSQSGPAVFYDLERLQPGELVHVLAANGSELTFRVREALLYWATDAPVQDIFRPDGPPELVLITCGGEFDRGSAMYLQRRVVYAELVS